jgi:3',5'-cyclic-nucleotide phosphodiesterase
VTPIGVDHSVPTCGFLVDDGSASICYTGDTGPTDRIWEVLSKVSNLRAVITEVSYPNRLHDLSLIAGHLTPDTFAEQVAKLECVAELPLYVYGLKPVYEQETRAELDQLRKKAGLKFELVESGETLEFS